MARIRKGDVVLVRSGDDAGKRGRVLRVIPEKERAIVEGVNIVFKHLKKSRTNPQGGRVQREAAVHVSKLTLVDPTTDEATRVSWRTEDGVKRRHARRSGAAIDVEAKPRGKRAKAEG